MHRTLLVFTEHLAQHYPLVPENNYAPGKGVVMTAGWMRAVEDSVERAVTEGKIRSEQERAEVSRSEAR